VPDNEPQQIDAGQFLKWWSEGFWFTAALERSGRSRLIFWDRVQDWDSTFTQHLALERDIFACHSFDREAVLEMPADCPPIEYHGPRNRRDRLVDVLNYKAGHAIVDNLWH
jgi:hypothetical protein